MKRRLVALSAGVTLSVGIAVAIRRPRPRGSIRSGSPPGSIRPSAVRRPSSTRPRGAPTSGATRRHRTVDRLGPRRPHGLEHRAGDGEHRDLDGGVVVGGGRRLDDGSLAVRPRGPHGRRERRPVRAEYGNRDPVRSRERDRRRHVGVGGCRRRLRRTRGARSRGCDRAARARFRPRRAARSHARGARNSRGRDLRPSRQRRILGRDRGSRRLRRAVERARPGRQRHPRLSDRRPRHRVPLDRDHRVRRRGALVADVARSNARRDPPARHARDGECPDDDHREPHECPQLLGVGHRQLAELGELGHGRRGCRTRPAIALSPVS